MPLERRKHLGFISPATPGSMGDQAMLDAANTYANTLGIRTVIFPYAPALRSAVRVYRGSGKFGVAAATARGLWSASYVFGIGADILDGVYNANTVLKRLKALQTAHLFGRHTRILGSSWSTTPSPEVISFLKSTPWLDILARDPVSQGRMEADLGRPISLAADLAFLLEPEARSTSAKKAIAWATARKAEGCTVLAANLSGHTMASVTQPAVRPAADMIGRWLATDAKREVLIVPHDTRGGFTGDLTVCRELHAILNERYGHRLHMPDGGLDAWDAKAIAGAVDLVLTGRMHFAIAALGQGTPPVSIVYQGKFEGLMQHFGLEREGLLMAPDMVGDSDAVLAAATARADRLRAQISERLPRVVALSKSNFDGL